MKRFTDTGKWSNPWFRKLSPGAKLLWFYLVDHCDQVGIVDVDFDLLTLDCGIKITPSHVTELGDRVQVISDSKLFITKFIHFHYGDLSPDCAPHKKVLNLISKYGIDRVGLHYAYPSPRVVPTLNGQEANQTGLDVGPPKVGLKPLEEPLLGAGDTRLSRLYKLFGRKRTTHLSPGEKKSFRAYAELCPIDEFELVEAYYASGHKDCRRSLETMLNNWNGEVDRARGWTSRGLFGESRPRQVPGSAPNNGF